MRTILDTRLPLTKVQPRLRLPWDGKAHWVIPKQLNGYGAPDHSWDLASTVWGNRATVSATDLQPPRNNEWRFGGGDTRTVPSHTPETYVYSPTPTVARAVAFAGVEDFRTSPG